jgi:hypothetical protein
VTPCRRAANHNLLVFTTKDAQRSGPQSPQRQLALACLAAVWLFTGFSQTSFREHWYTSELYRVFEPS